MQRIQIALSDCVYTTYNNQIILLSLVIFCVIFSSTTTLWLWKTSSVHRNKFSSWWVFTVNDNHSAVWWCLSRWWLWWRRTGRLWCWADGGDPTVRHSAITNGTITVGHNPITRTHIAIGIGEVVMIIYRFSPRGEMRVSFIRRWRRRIWWTTSLLQSVIIRHTVCNGD